MPTLVVAEKPSVARDIARVLGARTREDGYFRGDGYAVTWAIGHLVGLAEPHEIRPEWKRWRLSDLPILPAEWPLVVVEETRAQFEVVKRLLHSNAVEDVICATDAGREGELIFRYVYDAAGCRKAVRRLWISSLTDGAIAEGFRALKDGGAYDALANAARARSRADWLVGMNLSRAYSLVHDDNLSVGRVQTPTLAMVVTRELEIRAFIPEDYFEVVATFAKGAGPAFDGTWFRGESPHAEGARKIAKAEEAERIATRSRTGSARIEVVDQATRTVPPPLLFDLTELQRHANRLFGMSAQRTLDVAQSLYERKKVLSYPRTASRHLSTAVAETLLPIVESVRAPYAALLAEGTGERPIPKRFVDDGAVTDHHAIIPTGARASDLTEDERRIYDLVRRSLLMAWQEDHVFAVTTVRTAVTSQAEEETAIDRFVSTGIAIEQEGWKRLEVQLASRDGSKTRPSGEQPLPGGLAVGNTPTIEEAKSVAKKTRPPPRYTEGSP